MISSIVAISLMLCRFRSSTYIRTIPQLGNSEMLSRNATSWQSQQDDSLKDLGKHLLVEEQYRLENKANVDTSKGSKKQSCLTESTMAAEFVASASCYKETEWQRDLLINIPLWPKPMPPISMHCDSQSTLSRAYNQVYNVSREVKVHHPNVTEVLRDLENTIPGIVLSYGNNLDKVHLSECGNEVASYEFKGLALKHYEKPR
ncbi:hypothetical protein Tco_1288873 [Tanacetum coccineum]